MNFNLVLDYFNNKGKDRVKLEKIKNAFDNIQEYMKTGISGSLNKDWPKILRKMKLLIPQQNLN